MSHTATASASRYLIALFLVLHIADISASGIDDNLGLFIGINTHHDDNLKDLSYCVKDAKEIRQRMTGDDRLVLANHSQLIISDIQNPDSRSSKNDILNIIQKTAKNVKTNSLIFISISGHGVTGSDNLAYIIPSDGYLDKIPATCIKVQEIIEILSTSKAATKILLIDACRSPKDLLPQDSSRNLSTTTGGKE